MLWIWNNNIPSSYILCMCVDLCVDLCINLCIELCVDLCIDLCIDLCTDLCLISVLICALISRSGDMVGLLPFRFWWDAITHRHSDGGRDLWPWSLSQPAGNQLWSSGRRTRRGRGPGTGVFPSVHEARQHGEHCHHQPIQLTLL